MLHSEEAQRRRRRTGSVHSQDSAGAGSQPSSSMDSLGESRRDSVVDVRTDAPSVGSPLPETPAPTPSSPAPSSTSAAPTASLFAAPKTTGSSSRSYAAAARTSTNFTIEFSIGGNVVTRDTTIFGSVYRHEQARIGHASAPNVWNKAFEVKYRKIYPADKEDKKEEETRKAEEGDKTKSPKGKEDAHLAVKLPFSTNMPSAIEEDSAPGKVLNLLRLLHGLNTRWAEVYADFEADAVGASTRRATDSAAPVSVSPLSPSTFTNNKITAKLNRQLDEPLIVAAHVLPSWCASISRDFSFLVPFETRLVYLQSTSFGYSRSMTRWQHQQNQGNGAGGSGGNRRGSAEPPVLGRTARQKVRIQRGRIVDSMIKVMDLYGSAQALLEVEFFDEVGTGLGPTLEFYSSVCREVRKRHGVDMAGSSQGLEKYDVWRDDGAEGNDVKPAGSEAEEGKANAAKVEVQNYLNPALGLFPAPMSKGEAALKKGR